MIKFGIFSIILGAVFVLFGINIDKSAQVAQTAKTAEATEVKDSKPCFFVQVDSLNLRLKPNLDSKILKKLDKNTKICEYSTLEQGFLRTNEGYVFAKYLHLSKAEVAQIPQITMLQTPKIPPTTQKFSLTSKEKSTQSNTQLAQLALQNKDYKKAKNLALQINKEDPKNLKSWEIFAKSVYLEGNKEEAMMILQNFLQQNKNEKITELLEKMQQGASFEI